jgi:hypothetical protein
MAIANLYSVVQPSLLLDFANVKALDPRITFSRASTARYYNGVTVAKAEENLISQSEAFNDSGWTKFVLTATANTSTAPDGTSTADTITATATNASHALFRDYASVASGVTFTMSGFFKAGTNDFVQLGQYGSPFGTAAFANFDLSTGVLGTVGAAATASITSVGNGWYRCAITSTTTSSGTIGWQCFLIDSSTSVRGQTWLPAGTETVLVWGAQLEQRTAVTAYTATTDQPITNYIPVLLTANNNVARFDHNPTTGESLGLLVEEQRTNLLLRSEEFDNASWTETNVTITANTIVGPDGTLTADYVAENSANGAHRVSQTISVTSGTAYSTSVFVKAGGRTFVQLFFSSAAFGSNGYANFNLSTGAVGTVGSGSTATITAVGNGWYRCALTATAIATSASAAVTFQIITSATAARNESYTGDGYSGIFLWGAQLEAGAFATSYIPTTSASATRSADAASMTGANFSSWYRADQGTVYAEFVTGGTPVTGVANRYVCDIADSAGTNRLLFSWNTSNKSQFQVVSGNTTYANLNSVASLVSGSTYKLIGGYKVDDFGMSLDAAAVVADTSGLVPSGVTFISIGNRYTGSEYLNGTIKKLSFYPAKLTSAQLQALTTA